MGEALLAAEPNPEAQFCRRFGQEFPDYLSLSEVRADMDQVEPQLISAIAEQKMAMDRMVNSKNELPNAAFVEQHCINIGRIMVLAEDANPGLEGFERLVENTYFDMVPIPLSIRYDLRRDPELESRIVGLLGERCRLVRQAAFFKRDLRESTAPARQARNIANAREIASEYADRIPDFEDYIEAIYEDLVPGSVALQHRFLGRTQPAARRHQVRGTIALLASRQEN